MGATKQHGFMKHTLLSNLSDKPQFGSKKSMQMYNFQLKYTISDRFPTGPNQTCRIVNGVE